VERDKGEGGATEWWSSGRENEFENGFGLFAGFDVAVGEVEAGEAVVEAGGEG
jgi:hypothetical protein